jgi:hypothetical protein
MAPIHDYARRGDLEAVKRELARDKQTVAILLLILFVSIHLLIKQSFLNSESKKMIEK